MMQREAYVVKGEANIHYSNSNSTQVGNYCGAATREKLVAVMNKREILFSRAKFNIKKNQRQLQLFFKSLPWQ